MKNKTLAFIDIETTGLNPLAGHQIIEFCAVKVRPGGSRERLYYKVLPNSGVIDPVAISINGYTPELWSGGISQEELAKNLAQFLDRCVPVGHIVKFDVSFILELWREYDIQATLDRRILDTQFLADQATQPSDEIGPALVVAQAALDDQHGHFGTVRPRSRERECIAGPDLGLLLGEVLQVLRPDVPAVDDDDVFLPARDDDVLADAVTNVAGVEPAIVRQHLRRHRAHSGTTARHQRGKIFKIHPLAPFVITDCSAIPG